MVKKIVRDPMFLQQKSEPATEADKQVSDTGYWKKIEILLKLTFPGAIYTRIFESWQKRMFC